MDRDGGGGAGQEGGKDNIGIPVFRACQGHWDLSTNGCTVC